MDEKQMVSLNALNEAFRDKLDVRIERGKPTPDSAVDLFGGLVKAGEEGPVHDFAHAWMQYYPTVMRALGFLDVIIPGAKADMAFKVMTALLETINDQLIPRLHGPQHEPAARN